MMRASKPRRRAGGWIFGVALGLLAGSGAWLVSSADEGDTALHELAAPVLAALIVESRDAAVLEGVEHIPPAIRADLQGYVPDEVLDRVRWRIGGGGLLSLQRNLIGFGYTPAVTLDHVVVFERADDARDPKLWVHELRHVEQFAAFGIDGFVARYLRDHATLETDAWEYRWTWMKLTGRVPPPSIPTAD